MFLIPILSVILFVLCADVVVCCVVSLCREWCERNYSTSPYFAEFWNALSSIPIFLFAVVGYVAAKRYAMAETRCDTLKLTRTESRRERASSSSRRGFHAASRGSLTNFFLFYFSTFFFFLPSFFSFFSFQISRVIRVGDDGWFGLLHVPRHSSSLRSMHG